QQPSDVYTLLEDSAGGKKMSPEQIHPGFPDLDTAYQFIDMQAAQDPDLLERYRLVPAPAEDGSGDGTEDWIFPPTISAKFSGKRLRVPPHGSNESRERAPYALLVWQGEARFQGQALRAGDEAFVAHATASAPHRIEATGGEPLELFKFFPAE